MMKNVKKWLCLLLALGMLLSLTACGKNKKRNAQDENVSEADMTTEEVTLEIEVMDPVEEEGSPDEEESVAPSNLSAGTTGEVVLTPVDPQESSHSGKKRQELPIPIEEPDEDPEDDPQPETPREPTKDSGARITDTEIHFPILP